MVKPIPVIIDCDPGCDDAVALMLAFGCGRLEVLGISTVAGNVPGEATFRNARYLAKEMGIQVEIARGADKPLMRPAICAGGVHGATGLGDIRTPDLGPLRSPRKAWELIAGVLASSEQKVVLVPTGPLTNIAISILAFPEIKKKCSEIVLMGGSAGAGNVTPSAEFNIWADPEAAAIVFNSGIPITMVGLDATHKALIYPDEIEKLRKIGHLGGLLGRMMDSYSVSYRARGFAGNPIHDALAVAAVFQRDIVVTEHLRVDIETAEQNSFGRTVVDFQGVTGKPPNCRVALDVDRAGFVNLLFAAIEALEKKRRQSAAGIGNQDERGPSCLGRERGRGGQR